MKKNSLNEIGFLTKKIDTKDRTEITYVREFVGIY